MSVKIPLQTCLLHPQKISICKGYIQRRTNLLPRETLEYNPRVRADLEILNRIIVPVSPYTSRKRSLPRC